MNKPEFQFGDLVHVAGYEPQVFSIDGYREETYHYPDEVWTDLVYELHDVGTGEWIEADSEDLSLVAPVDQADEYLSANPAPAKTEGPKITLIFGMEAKEVKKEDRKPTARELSSKEAAERKKARKERAEQIDILLDIRNWNSEMLAKTGNEEFGDRVLAIDCELKKITDN